MADLQNNHDRQPAVITKEANKPITSPYIELFELDLTPVGLEVMGFTNSFEQDGKAIYFNKRPYYSLPIKAEGFEMTTDGSVTTPTLSLGAVDKMTAALVLNHNDLLGCKVTRIRTFETFLDNGATPNPAARFATDEYVINRRKSLDKYSLEFELTNIINFEEKQLPKNQVVKTFCQFIYRRWNGSTFIVDKYYPCPYAGNKYFDEDNKTVDKSKDKCNKRISGCQARYGNELLPFQGFPGIAR